MMEDRAKLFGNDLRLVTRAGGEDLFPTLRRDLDLARGNDNIVQALRLRLRVRRGELAPLGWPDYGSRLHELIGEPDVPRTHVLAMAHARRALERDPRVAEVTDVHTRTLPGDRDVLRLQIEVLLIEQDHPLNLVFDLEREAS